MHGAREVTNGLWPWLRGLPLWVHLVGASLLVQTVVLGVVYVGQVRLINSAILDLAKVHAAQTTPLLASALSNAMAQRDYASAQAILNESVSADGIASITIIDATARQIAHAPPGQGIGAGETFETVVPLTISGQSLGQAKVRFSLSAINALYDKLLVRRLIMVSISLLVAVVGFSVVTYFIIRPLNRLTEASRALASGTLVEDPGAVIGAEIAVLQRSFTETSLAIREQVTALEAARKLAEQASQAKSEFLGKVSHEIRTPMNGVMGMIDVLRDTKLDAQQKELADIAYSSSESLMAIINDILDFSKIEAGKLQLEFRPFALKSTLVSVTQLFSGSASRKGLSLELDIAADLPEFTQGDALRFRQVLSNLVGNAIKFTERGAVTVSAWSQQGGRELAVRVADTGIGIEPAALATIFDPFVQADNSNARRFGGTGLGLSIVKNLAEAMGGGISVASTPAKGSTFTLRLPLAAAPAPALVSEPAIAALLPLQGMRVLLVEDNEINRRLAEYILDKFGCVRESAIHGKEALAKLETASFDVVLMDCQMPVMDGFEATAAIREREQRTGAPRIPIIAVTANAAESDRELCLAHGMDDYLSKPYTVAALNGVLTKALVRTVPRKY
jgi:signal transduction histidine kinase/ActR/RegA family two-component response regulator